jgi:hypothetical protein
VRAIYSELLLETVKELNRELLYNAVAGFSICTDVVGRALNESFRHLLKLCASEMVMSRQGAGRK